MTKRWWETKEYALADGTWAPEVHVFEEGADGLTVVRLLPPNPLSFKTRDDARAFSTSMGVRFLTEGITPPAT